ncbi:MAG: GNAT family N-acetyltransferase [Gammaproteobacteria bacterium]
MTTTTVTSARLLLRPLDDGDCTPDYVAWLEDPEVNQFLETRHQPQTLESVREFVRAVNARDNEHLFGIFLREGARHIGNIKVGPVLARHPVADVSLLIGARDCWGQGYAAEAIRAVSEHAFRHLGVRKLAAGMYVANQGSLRAFLKAGYRQEGHRRAHYLVGDQMSDVIEVGLLPADLA